MICWVIMIKVYILTFESTVCITRREKPKENKSRKQVQSKIHSRAIHLVSHIRSITKINLLLLAASYIQFRLCIKITQ